MGLGSELVSKVVGYEIKKGNFNETSPNLPQRVVILAEANTANQGTLDTTQKEVTTAQQAGTLYGYGSPIYSIMRILRPAGSSGIGGIPTIVMPQAAAQGATSKILEVTPTGVATGNGTHTMVIAGRTGLDAVFYDINIVEGDTTDDITVKMKNAVNAVLGSPVTATSTDYEATFETKWKGLTANELSITVDTGDDTLGITYSVASTQSGSGTPSIAGALSQFQNAWNTIVINSYGTVTSIMDALEAFNGIPKDTSPTGRYAGIVMKPFIAITGSVADDPSSITDPRKAEVTIAIAPAPGSAGFSFEAAANMALLHARVAQDTPHVDVNSMAYPDMPTPTGSIGSMADYLTRDAIVKKGCSTVDKVAGAYVVQDFVTTYHPDGETPPQFRYCRNLQLDFNVRYGVYLLEQIHVVDHAISNDTDTVSVSKTVKPKQWRAVLDSYADDLGRRALIADVPFMQNNTTVAINGSNPDRLDVSFKYKRSGIARIVSTEGEAGFNFGNV